jgi:hypothetical protein
MKFGFDQIHKPTPASIVKLGSTLIGVGGSIATYTLTMGDKIVGYIGVGLVAVGTFLHLFFGEDNNKPK